MYRTKPRFREMVWGSKKLNEIFSQPVGKYPLGEVWVLSGLEPMITPLVKMSGEEIEPSPGIAGLKAERFPLLIKVIAPSRWLSIQVHPDDELAQKLEGEPWGKTEGWYFVEGGKVALGRSKDTVLEAVESGNWKDALVELEMEKGDFLYLPAGVVHTLGPGSLLIEVQQASDKTYRIYDWRRPRELHVEKAKMAIKDFDPESLIFKNANRFECDHFNFEMMDLGNVKGFASVVFLEDGRIDGEPFGRFEVCVLEEGEEASFEGKAIVFKLGRFWERFRPR